MELRAEQPHLSVISSVPGERQKRSNTGDYDAEILCAECDQHLGRLDDYGKRVLLDDACEFSPIAKQGEVAGWFIEGADPVRLEKFFLAVLWRASLTARDFFSRVRLGPYEDELKDYLWSGDDSHPAFGCTVARFDPSQQIERLEKTVRSPDRFRYEQMNFYRVYLGGYMVWARVDRRVTDKLITRVELGPGRRCVVIRRPFDSSKEFESMLRAV